jgi:small redox-active disulfide protein 2
MKIEVLGSGCPTCRKLFDLTSKVVKEMGLSVEVEYVTDIQKIVKMGLMQSPVLAINGQPVLAGYVPDGERLKKIIIENVK